MDPRRRLEEERARVLERAAGLAQEFDEVVAASKDTNADDEHDPEGTTIAYERSQIDAVSRRVREHLAEVDAALERLAAGRYGVCETCGEPIAEARLDARPTARRCIACA